MFMIYNTFFMFNSSIWKMLQEWFTCYAIMTLRKWSEPLMWIVRVKQGLCYWFAIDSGLACLRQSQGEPLPYVRSRKFIDWVYLTIVRRMFIGPKNGWAAVPNPIRTPHREWLGGDRLSDREDRCTLHALCHDYLSWEGTPKSNGALFCDLVCLDRGWEPWTHSRFGWFTGCRRIRRRHLLGCHACGRSR